MNVSFQDLQDLRNPRNGQTIGEQSSIVGLLDELREVTPPFMCQLVGDNGFNLTVGIDHDFGCVQHSANDGTSPYLMATNPAKSDSDQREMTFLVGGTATPIDGRYRLAFEIVAEIVAEFVRSGKRSDRVSWEEFETSV